MEKLKILHEWRSDRRNKDNIYGCDAYYCFRNGWDEDRRRYGKNIETIVDKRYCLDSKDGVFGIRLVTIQEFRYGYDRGPLGGYHRYLINSKPKTYIEFSDYYLIDAIENPVIKDRYFFTLKGEEKYRYYFPIKGESTEMKNYFIGKEEDKMDITSIRVKGKSLFLLFEKPSKVCDKSCDSSLHSIVFEVKLPPKNFFHADKTKRPATSSEMLLNK